MLYRATYIRDGRPHGMTFSASSPEKALTFYTWWEARLREWSPGTTVLTVRKVRSRVGAKGKRRRD